MTSSKKYVFNERLTALSVSNIWERVIEEWDIKYVIKRDDKCLCGHPILNTAILKHKYSDTVITVGSTCVKKFFGTDISFVFKEMDWIYEDKLNVVSDKTLKFINTLESLTEWEIAFYKDTRKKKLLTIKQEEKRKQINEKLCKIFFKNEERMEEENERNEKYNT